MISSDNSLFIDYSMLLAYPCSITVTSWHGGIACFGLSNGETTTFNHFLDDPGLPFEDILNSAEAKPWLDTFPDHILATLQTYHADYGVSVYPLIWLLSRHQIAVDLFVSNPLLMLIMMHCASRHRWSERRIVDFLSQKRVYILEKCYLDGGKPLLKLLNKLSLKKFNHRKYQCLQRLIALPKWQTINHLKYVDDSVILLITQHPELLSSRLLQSYDENWSKTRFRSVYSDTLRMATLQNQAQVFNCRTLDDLERLHERYIIEINQRKNNENVEYYVPPISGSRYIIPIRNSVELRAEGEIQEHCVASYHQDILRKKCYIYKILQPERATLELNTPINGDYSIAQLRLYRNGAPSEETIRSVQQWLHDYKRREQKRVG